MNIAFLVRTIPPVIDGVGEYTWHLCHALRASGVNAHIFTSTDQVVASRPKADWIHPVIPEWRGEVVAEALGSVTAFRPDWCCFQYVPQMYGKRGICWAASGVPLALKQSLNCRVATTFHEFISAWSLNLKDAVLAAVTRWQTRRLLAGCNLAITTCSRYKEHLQVLASRPLPIVVIPVGANSEPVQMLPGQISRLRQHYSLDGAKVFGIFGRLSPWRNYQTAIRVLERAKLQGLKACLLMIGCVQSSNPRLFAELRQLARKLGVESEIVVTGELRAEAVSAHLQLVDVFLFPQADGVSTRNTTIMAALAHGLPIVTFAPEAGNFDGYQIPYRVVVPPRHEESFVYAAVKVLEEIDSHWEGSNANTKYFEEHFSWPRIARQYLKAFASAQSATYPPSIPCKIQ